jgi:simple sugar transport system ATP-binding protein
MHSLASSGCSIVFVSHKLEEVCAAADRITVMRDGRLVAQVERGAVDPRELARLMVGREVREPTRPTSMGRGETALTLDDASAHDDHGRLSLDRVSFVLRRGEILGVAGVAGNGQRELAEVIAGLRPTTSGHVRWGPGDRDITNASLRDRSRLGLAYVPEDRMGTAIAASLPVWINLSLRDFDRPEFALGPFVRTGRLRSNSDRLAREFGVRGQTGSGPTRHLSGGNIQRLVLARELEHDPTVMIAASPTRGLDVGAVVAVHELLYDKCAAGLAALIISEDLDELLTICGRVLVLFEGRVMGEFVPGQLDHAAIGSMMTGHHPATGTAAPPAQATTRQMTETLSDGPAAGRDTPLVVEPETPARRRAVEPGGSF